MVNPLNVELLESSFKALAPKGELLAQRHQAYGALPEHYPAVAGTLLGVMEELAGDLWTPETKTAWEDAQYSCRNYDRCIYPTRN